MNHCNHYHEVLRLSTFIRRYCGRIKPSIRYDTKTAVRSCFSFLFSADRQQPSLRFEKQQQYHKSTLNDVRYFRWLPCYNRGTLKTRGTRRSTMILPYQQTSQQQQYRSMLCFEYHVDATKSLHEVPKIVDDEDIVHSFLTISLISVPCL